MAKNIILVIADDLGRNLGICGAFCVRMANLDKLASEDGPTHENGQLGLLRGFGSLHYFTTFDHVESAPKLFNKLSHKTGIVNKVHVGPDAVYPFGFREESATRDVAWTDRWDFNLGNR